MQRVNGFVERGNTTVLVGGVSSSNVVEGSFPSATVSVFLTGTQTLATIYGDNGVTLKANPFTAANDGSFFFYAANGRYDIQFSGTGLVGQTFSVGDVLVLDSAQFSSAGTTVAFTTTPAFSCVLFSFFEITLTGNVTGPTFSGQALWQVIHLTIIQDGTGGRTWAWPGSFVHPPTIASGANAVTECSFFWDGANWRNFAATGDSLVVPGAATIAGALAVTGATTLTGALTANGNAASGNVALKYGTADAVLFVSTTGNDSNDGLSPGTAKATIQAAINALPSRGGLVRLLGGTYVQNTSLTLKSNLTIQGVGRGDTTFSPATLITTTLGSGDLFPITNLTEVCLRDFSVSNIGAAGANACIRLNYGQRCVCQRLFINGPFAVGIELDSSSTSAGSTIRNWFDNILITGLANNGIGVLLNSNDATNKVINNNVFWMVATQGGATGASACGLKVTNSNNLQNINENFFYGDEFATSSAVGGGTGILVTATATRGMTFIGCNVENNVTGLNKASGNVLSFFGGNFSSNTSNVTDAQPSFTQFIGTNVGGVTQQFSITPAGDMNVDGIGLNSTALTNTINGPAGWAGAVAGTTKFTVNANDVNVKRLKAGQGSSVYSGADAAIVPNAVNGAGGWGSGAVVANAGGVDQGFSFAVTAAGTPGANPTTVVTFKDGTWTNSPVFLVVRNDTNSPVSTGPPVTWTNTATTITITFIGTPVAGTSYNFNVLCVGR